MEGLLPLLIAVGASIALSLLKKKPAPPGESDRLPQDSPWDDLLREIQRKETAQGEVEPETVETDEVEWKPVRPIIPATTDVKPHPDPDTQLEKAATFADSRQSVPFSYDAGAIAAALERLEDIQEEDPLADIMLAGVADREIAAGELTDPVKTEDVQDIFAGGFDPRMAMLYSEILRPKYQE